MLFVIDLPRFCLTNNKRDNSSPFHKSMKHCNKEIWHSTPYINSICRINVRTWKHDSINYANWKSNNCVVTVYQALTNINN